MEEEGPTKKSKPDFHTQPPCTVIVSWLNLHIYIPVRDVRKIIYGKLTEFDRWMVEAAHNAKTLLRHYALISECVYHGTLNQLKWLVENEWGGIDVGTCRVAALYGRLDMLEWCVGILGSRVWHLRDITLNAVIGGHLHVLQCAEKHVENKQDTRLFSLAVEDGHLHIMTWLRENNYSLDRRDRDLCTMAARNGHLDVLKWLVENGFPYNIISISQHVLKPQVKDYLITLPLF